MSIVKSPKQPKFPLLRTQWILALLLLIAQAGITVTGSIVRVTGSGLGCPTWPTCNEGSLVPVAGAAPWIHQAIEFGNRLLTFVLVTLALALFLSVLAAKRRKEIILHSFAQGIGIIVQAIIGGISVLLDLQWWAVALHFLPSMLLVWLAAILLVRIKEPDEGVVVPLYPAPLKWLAAGSGATLAIVLMTGTMVTGAGPHSGDEGVGMQGRLEVDIAEIAHLHAHSMYLYLGLTIGLVVALLTVRASVTARKLGWTLIGFIVLQAAIGIIQYNWGVPRWTVPVHVGLSGVVCAFTGMLYAQHQTRSAVETLTGSARGDAKIATTTRT